jgi:hypothetical protein
MSRVIFHYFKIADFNTIDKAFFNTDRVLFPISPFFFNCHNLFIFFQILFQMIYRY